MGTRGASVAPAFPYGLGWLHEWPDVRDYTPEHPSMLPLIEKTAARAAVGAAPPAAAPKSVDLRQWCSPIEDQGQLGSCTAHAAVGLVEYFERRAFGKHIDGSRLFTYKVTRSLLHWTGDTGAYLRSAMQALVMFGVPPEEYYPYDVLSYDEEPPAFCYALAANYKAVKYFRLDIAGEPTNQALLRVKQFLAAGYPSMFGFTVYNSISQADQSGEIPFPGPHDQIAGGHAVMTVGYDDNKKIGGTTGALLIRNSWGPAWGQVGYGWLPYAYVLRGIADDFWSVQSQNWVDTGNFG